MPIPQLKSNFKKRRIGDRQPSFKSRRIVSDIKTRKKKRKKRFVYQSKSTPPRKKKLWKRLTKRFWPHTLAAAFLFIIFIVAAFAWYSRDLPEPGKIMDRSIALSTKIYDRSGEVLLYEVHGEENRSLITIDTIPDYVKQATIAIEDKNFYNHKGISLWGIIRSQIVPRLQGKRAQGGSTLTQQFVKNAILTSERKLSRKIKEWILSYQIEKKYDKDQILEFYLNEIPYGGAVYGVEAASKYYFDKSVNDITIAEAATLAALPQAPTLYSPYGSNRDSLIGRQHYILDLMVEQDYITAEQAEEAKQQELVFKKRAENIKAPHFVMYIRELLEQEYGATMIEQSGWTITTSLDWEAQELAEKTIGEIAPDNLENFEASNAALVSIDVDTGQILAMVGSKDYFDDEIDGQVNVATASRQPGSSMKPFVYLKAFSKGYRPETVLFDLVTNFASAGDDYMPHNYDLEERGPVTIRQALAGSLNVPAVKALYLAGVYEVVELANKFGYSTLTDPDRYGLSLVLGGAEVKLLEHVNAYATLARDGTYKDIVPILEIKDAKDKTIEKNDENKGRRAIDKEYVRVLNGILSDNSARAYAFGENNFLTLPDRQAAAKTGTTNDYRDAWLIGFTPNVATGVWVGNNDNTAMKQGASGSVVAAPIWNRFMREYTQNYTARNFKTHELDACDKPMVCGELGKENIVRIDKVSGKLATEYTPYTQIEEKKYLEVHNILHYVNTNDPLGEPLSDPSSDPQYSLWEEKVMAWVESEGYTNEEPPTEFDDVHLPELQPDITWVDPNNNETINQGTVTLKVDASASRGVNRVEYFIDDQLIGTDYSSPFSYTYTINPFLNNGKHKLKAIAFTNKDNFKASEIDINLDVSNEARDYNLVWIKPTNGDTIKLDDLPMTLKLNIDHPDKIKKIDFYYLSEDDRSHFFGYLESLYQSSLTVGWGEGLEAGVYKLYMVVKDNSNNLITTPAIIVNVEE